MPRRSVLCPAAVAAESFLQMAASSELKRVLLESLSFSAEVASQSGACMVAN